MRQPQVVVMLRQEEAKMVRRVTFYLVILQITNESSLFVALHYDSNIFSGVTFKKELPCKSKRPCPVCAVKISHEQM